MRVRVLMFCGWFLLLVAGHAATGGFAVPSDGPVAFRRDRLPLDIQQISRLSDDLVVLAGAMDGGSAEGRRAVAQALALSLALQPGNAKARAMLKEWSQGRSSAPVRGEPLRRVAKHWEPMVEWLVSDAAGADGRALADCMTDLLKPAGLDRDSRLGKWVDIKERGNWDGWVAGLHEFRPGVPKPEKSAEAPPVDASITAGTKEGKWSGYQSILKTATTVTPLWQKVAGGSDGVWDLAPHPLTATVTRNDSGGAFRLRVGGHGGPMDLSPLEGRMIMLLRGYFSDLPGGVELQVTSAEFERSLDSGKDLSVGAPVAVVCSAVLTGREPVAKVIGTVDRHEKLQVGGNFWRKLRSLAGGPGGRLVVPEDAEVYLKAMLTAEGAQFFLKHEVLVAEDLDGLLDRALLGGSDDVKSASEKFKVICDYSKDQDVMNYIRNSHVRKRLMEVVQTDSGHASARMLLMMGDGRQPKWLPQSVLLEELARITVPAASIGQITYAQLYQPGFEPPPAASMAEDLQREIGKLERLSDAGDRDAWRSPVQNVHEHLVRLTRALEQVDDSQRRVQVVQTSRELSEAVKAVGRIAGN